MYLPNKETIYRYFSQELLSRLTEESRNFIVRSSLMDEIDFTLASEALNQDKAALLLNGLEHQHIPLSHSGEPPVYRYHPLFLGFLRLQAENSLKAEEKKNIIRKAALVFLKRKDFVKASKHYLVSEDPQRAVQVLNSGVKRMLHEQRFLTVSELLSRRAPPDDFLFPDIVHCAR